MTKVLIKTTGNWADEFGIFGIQIMEKSQILDIMIILNFIQENKIYVDVSWSFGTNEGFDDLTVQGLKEMFVWREISEDEEIFMKKHFNGVERFGIGQNIYFYDILDLIVSNLGTSDHEKELEEMIDSYLEKWGHF